MLILMVKIIKINLMTYRIILKTSKIIIIIVIIILLIIMNKMSIVSLTKV